MLLLQSSVSLQVDAVWVTFFLINRNGWNMPQQPVDKKKSRSRHHSGLESVLVANLVHDSEIAKRHY